MSHFYANQTADLSASMTSSSLNSEMQDISSVVSTSDKQIRSPVDLPDPIGSDEVDQTCASILTALFCKGSYDTVLEIADELLLKFPRSIFLNNIIAETNAIIDEDHKAIHHYKLVLNEKPEPHSYFHCIHHFYFLIPICIGEKKYVGLSSRRYFVCMGSGPLE